MSICMCVCVSSNVCVSVLLLTFPQAKWLFLGVSINIHRQDLFKTPLIFLIPSVTSLNPSLLFLFLSFQDPSFSLLLHDKLQVPNSSRRAWNERDSRCDVCSTHLTQLKQEAVRMVLTLDQWDLSPTSSPPALIGRYGSQGPPGPMGASGTLGGSVSRDWPPPFLPSSSSALSHPPHTSSQSPSPSPSQTPTPSPSHGSSTPSHGSPSVGQTSCCAPTNPQPQGAGHRLGSKPSSLGLGGGVDRRNGSPSSGKATSAQQQPVTGVNSPSNNGGNSSNNGSGSVLSTAALQAHQHLNRTNGGVTLYPYQVWYLEIHRCVCMHVCFIHSELLFLQGQNITMETETKCILFLHEPIQTCHQCADKHTSLYDTHSQDRKHSISFLFTSLQRKHHLLTRYLNKNNWVFLWVHLTIDPNSLFSSKWLI